MHSGNSSPKTKVSFKNHNGIITGQLVTATASQWLHNQMLMQVTSKSTQKNNTKEKKITDRMHVIYPITREQKYF